LPAGEFRRNYNGREKTCGERSTAFVQSSRQKHFTAFFYQKAALMISYLLPVTAKRSTEVGKAESALRRESA